MLVLAAAIGLTACEKTEAITSEPLSAYQPLVIGKYITYRLDSTVFTNFGRNTEVHSYQEKHVIDAEVTDNLNRRSYRVFRFIRDTAGLQPWRSAGSYFVTPTEKSYEFIENNLRFVKLSLPIRQDHTWKGNNFLPDDPYLPTYNFNNDIDIADWDYRFDSLGASVVLNNKTYADVITVEGVDDSFNYPNGDPASYAFVNRVQDKYAKGIGLIAQVLTMWEYQPNTNGQGGGFRIGFGVKRTIIDNN